MPSGPSMRAGLQVWRAEGWRAVRDRGLDRLADARRRRSFGPPLAASLLGELPPELRTPVLHVAATPPAPWLGGVQAHLLARAELEARAVPFALLFPESDCWRLEVAAPAMRRAWEMQARPLSGASSPASAVAVASDFEAAVLRAAEAVGADFLRVEGLAGMPLGALLVLRRRGLRLLLALHDFAAFCPRPHLLEEPAGRFCGYSRDPERCAACLSQDWPVEVGWQEERRRTAGELLAKADSVVFSSEFLRRAHRELFPALDPQRQSVVAPEPAPPASLAPAPTLPTTMPPRHLAFIGSVKPHKGAAIFSQVVEQLEREAPGAVRWSVYGGGDADLLDRLRRLRRVRVRGYYRAGSLPRLLVRDGIDLGLLLSIVPESYGLTLSECRAAGVRVVAFDLGAPADRIRAEGGGILVPLEEGAAGVVRVLSGLIAGDRPPFGPSPPRPATTIS